MAIKKMVLAGAIAAALAGAGLVGALVSTTSVSYAEEATDEDSVGPPGPRGGGGPGHGRGAPASLEVAAEALGITEDELRTELEAGESVATVAEAQDVDLQTVIDALVEDATSRIQERVDAGEIDAAEAAERIAELPDRMAEFVAQEGLPERGRGGPGHGRGGPDSLEVAADALGITADELRTELQAGESITSVAAAQEVDVQMVIDALVEDATTRIQDRIDAGDLDAAKGAERIAELPDRMADFVAQEGLPERGPC